MALKTMATTALFTFVAVAPAMRAADKAAMTAQLDNILKTAVGTKAVPVVVAMVATTRDGIIYRRAVNTDEGTIFAIASMTKPITSVAVMQLVEGGKVRLDVPAATYLKELKDVQVLEAGELRKPKSPVTVRQLLTHTSGFAYEFMNKDVAGYASQGKVASMTAGSDAFLKAPLVADPGARWEYGISTDWLGKLVEAVSGQSLEEYFERHIFVPLGMKDSYFTVPPEKQGRLASVYRRAKDGSLEKLPASPFRPMGFFSGGGGLHSTASDYLRFSQALLAGGELDRRRILKTETVRMIAKNHIGDLTVSPFRSLIPQLATDGAVLPGSLDKFGLGFALNNSAIPSGRGTNTMSWAGIFNTFFWIDREKGVCAVLMTQMSPGLDEGPRKLLEDFDRAVYAGR
jgi:CubicO group peptidase (beta-lactamase class C family)